MSRLRILTFISYYLPGFRSGGPVRTLVAMTEQLRSEFQFLIITQDRDLGDIAPYPGIKPDSWNAVGENQIYYRSPNLAGARRLIAAMDDARADIVYLNSFFHPQSTILPLLWRRLGGLKRLPFVIAPRGELNPEALAIKTLKKQTYLWAGKICGLFRDLIWQASCDEEKQAIIAAIGAPETSIFVAPDLTGQSSGEPLALPVQDDTLRVVFLSRISLKKNLREAIAILSRVNANTRFDIYGMSDDQDYVEQCMSAARMAPAHISIAFKDMIEPEAVESVLAGYDLFFLPTRGENYGHAIREALSAGVPVLISDQTPWRGLTERNAGADLPLDDMGAFARWIDAFAALPPERRLEMRNAARELGDDPVASARNLEANRRMFEAVLASARG